MIQRYLLLSVLVFGWANPLAAGQVAFTEDPNDAPNPERGFFIPFNPEGNATQPLTTAKLSPVRATAGLSLIRRSYLYPAFRTQALPQSELDRIASDAALLRAAKLKMITRFHYTWSPGGDGGQDASAAQTIAHLAQLKPVLAANADVIYCVEGGLIGQYGEWHNSSHGNIDNVTLNANANTRAIYAAAMDAVPAERMYLIRYPHTQLQLTGLTLDSPLTAAQAFTRHNAARTGLHNDGFLHDRNDFGTYSSAIGIEKQKTFLQRNNLYTIQGGEEQNLADGSGIPGEAALREFARLRFSYFNYDPHDPSQKATFDLWAANAHLAEIKRRLGYRYVLVSASAPPTATAGTSLNLSLVMRNDGFAGLYNPRAAKLILRHQISGQVTALDATRQDVRAWLPTPGTSDNLAIAATLPADLAIGNYDLLLSFPDPAPTLSALPEYAIRLMNQGTWEATNGYNRLNLAVAVVAPLPTRPDGQSQ